MSKIRLKVTKKQLDQLVRGSAIKQSYGKKGGKYEVVLRNDFAKGSGLVGGAVYKFRSAPEKRLAKGHKPRGGERGPQSMKHLQALDRVSGNFLSPGRSFLSKSKGRGMTPIGSGFIPLSGKGLLPLGGSGFIRPGSSVLPFTSREPPPPEQY